ncbi:MAG: hypothetical protein IJO88_01105 [Oscillospiraceae bacterium]|nr:hypothetical protein [Oscillospiraceae bacterium]
MKKFLKIAAIIVLVIYGVFATIAVSATQNDYNTLYANYKDLTSQHQVCLEEQSKVLTESADKIVFEAIAKCISEQYYVEELGEETVMVAVYAEKRSMEEMVDTISEYSLPLAVALKNGNKTAIIAVMTDNNEVWFGYTVAPDGNLIPFLSEL